jgi:hypothetical protein
MKAALSQARVPTKPGSAYGSYHIPKLRRSRRLLLVRLPTSGASAAELILTQSTYVGRNW